MLARVFLLEAMYVHRVFKTSSTLDLLYICADRAAGLVVFGHREAAQRWQRACRVENNQSRLSKGIEYLTECPLLVILCI